MPKVDHRREFIAKVFSVVSLGRGRWGVMAAGDITCVPIGSRGDAEWHLSKLVSAQADARAALAAEMEVRTVSRALSRTVPLWPDDGQLGLF